MALRMGIGRARLVSSDINRRRDLDAVWILLRLSFHVTPWSPGEQTQATLVSPPAPGVPTTSVPSGASPRERMNGRALNSRGGSRGRCDQMTTNVMTEDGAQVSSRFKVGSQSRSRIEGRGGQRRGVSRTRPPPPPEAAHTENTVPCLALCQFKAWQVGGPAPSPPPATPLLASLMPPAPLAPSRSGPFPGAGTQLRASQHPKICRPRRAENHC